MEIALPLIDRQECLSYFFTCVPSTEAALSRLTGKRWNIRIGVTYLT